MVQKSKATTAPEKSESVDVVAPVFVSNNAWQLGVEPVWYVPVMNYRGPFLKVVDEVVVITTACGDVHIREVAYPDGVKPIGHPAGFTISAPPKLMSAISITYGIRGPLVGSADIHRLIQLSEVDGIVTFTNCYDGKWMPKICADVLAWGELDWVQDVCYRGGASEVSRPSHNRRSALVVDGTIMDLAESICLTGRLNGKVERCIEESGLDAEGIIKVLAHVVTCRIPAGCAVADIGDYDPPRSARSGLR